jgi:hypothetical protein
MRIKLIILCCFLSVLAKAQLALDTAAYAFARTNPATKHYITSWNQVGSFDTVIVKAGTNLGGGYLHGGGTILHPWVVVNEGGSIRIPAGLEIDDVQNLVLDGRGSAVDTFGFVFDAPLTVGFVVPIEGKSANIKLINVQINGGKDEGVTSKLESADLSAKYQCDMSYAYWKMHDLTLTNCKFRFNGGESWYINSSGWYGRDAVACPVNDTAIGNNSFDAQHRPINILRHSLTNTATSTRTFKVFNSSSNTITAIVNKISGTITGNVTFYGSNDSSSFTSLDVVSLTNATASYNKTYSGWQYYRVTISTTGTGSATDSVRTQWLHSTQQYYNITCDSTIFIAPGRSAVNYSYLHNSKFRANKGWHIGREMNTAQGKFIAGSADDSIDVENNKCFGSFHDAYWIQSEHLLIFKNNYWDSSGYYSTIPNSETNPGTLLGATNGRYGIPQTWVVCGNAGYRTKNAGNGAGQTKEFGLYPGPSMTTTGNYFGSDNVGSVFIDKTYAWSYSTTCGSSNIPPVVNAGSDVSITLPTTTVNLSGTATDADGTIASTTWSNSDGCSITSSSSLTTTATCTTAGDHIFTLTATDNSGAASTDQMKATVNPAANTPPVAIAQNDTTVYLPLDSLILNQSGTDADGTITAYLSSIIKSYFSPSINNTTSQHPVLKGLTAGDTILILLKVTDNSGAYAFDTTTIIVRPNASNNPPVAAVNRDTATEVRQPLGEISIDGSGSFDPDTGDHIAAYQWSLISGSSSIVMTGVNASILTLNNLDTGLYKFRLTVTDTHGATNSINFKIRARMHLFFSVIAAKTKGTSFKPLYGGVWANYTTPQKVQASRLFNMKENRLLVNFLTWNGSNSPVTNQVIDSGQLVSLNIHEANYTDTTHFSNVDLTAYRTHVNTLMSSLNTDSVLVVQGNEGDATAYHAINDSTALAPNINMASIVARAALANGIKSADGGITSEGILFTTYRYLSDSHDADTTNFLHYCIPVNKWTAVVNRSDANINAKIANAVYLMRRYDTIPFTYCTGHFYFPFAKRVNDTATNWRADYTGIDQVSKMLNYYYHGRQKITNEFGIVKNTPGNAAVINQVVVDLKRNNFIHQDYWNDATSPNVEAIGNALIALTILGSSYKTYIQ